MHLRSKKSLSHNVGPPRRLRVAPVDAFQHARHLRHRDRHHTVGCRGPDEASAIEPLGIKRRAKALVPGDLYQAAGAAAEDVKVAGALGSRFRPCCTCSARPCMPLRISVWPVATQTRTPPAIGITAPATATPPSPASPERPPRSAPPSRRSRSSVPPAAAAG